MSRKSYGIILIFLTTALLSACAGKKELPAKDSSPEIQWQRDQAEFHDNRITIINRRGCDLYALYLSPSSEDEWSDNVIGEYELPDHGELDADIPVSEEVRLWDIRLEDRDHELVELCQQDLSELVQEEMVMELAVEGGEDILYIYKRK